MKRPATWKVVTVGAAALGLGVIGAGTAMAEPTDALHESAAMTDVNSCWPRCDAASAPTSEERERNPYMHAKTAPVVTPDAGPEIIPDQKERLAAIIPRYT